MVSRDSSADMASNSITANGNDGIKVSENATVQLGEDSGTSIYESPNFGVNSGAGIRCIRGGIANARLGSLSGAPAKSFDASCIDSLIP